MEKIKIEFYDDYAYYKSENESCKVEKNDVTDDILKIKHYSNYFNIKKDNINDSVVYKINSNNFNIKIVFSKKHLRENKDYIDFFEKLIKQKRKMKLTYINIALISSLVSIGTLELAKRDFSIDELRRDINLHKIENSKEYAITELEEELEIHTYNHYVDGKLVYPQYGHDCVFENNEDISINDKVDNYCKQYITDDSEFLTSVETKFKFLFADDLEDADKINLNDEFNKIKTKN